MRLDTGLQRLAKPQVRFSGGQPIRLGPGETTTSLVTIDGFDTSLPGEYWAVVRSTTYDREKRETRTRESPRLKIGSGHSWNPLWVVSMMQYSDDEVLRKEWTGNVRDFAEFYACKLNEVARSDEEEEVRAAARAELQRLRTDIETMLSQLDSPPAQGGPMASREPYPRTPHEAERAIKKAQERTEAARKAALEAEKKKVEQEAQAQPEVEPAPEPPPAPAPKE